MISRLLKSCFQQNPTSRPNFDDIKEDLRNAYETLLRTSRMNQVTSHPDSGLTSMETQYATILKENATTISANDIDTEPENNPLMMDNKSMKYLTLEGMPESSA